ncbi:hypothetical protein PAHAL_4G027900 [Panicum hallii]|uniref:Uncharacterized protein n=1 Tax=Panicum hallii TaxID=206008 RepID=A0A2T8JBK5_9POAL|nr:hypothetical protein PAHAL_4G027900 [Panicum hallii]
MKIFGPRLIVTIRYRVLCVNIWFATMDRDPNWGVIEKSWVASRGYLQFYSFSAMWFLASSRRRRPSSGSPAAKRIVLASVKSTRPAASTNPTSPCAGPPRRCFRGVAGAPRTRRRPAETARDPMQPRGGSRRTHAPVRPPPLRRWWRWPAMAGHLTYIHEPHELIASSTTASAGSPSGSAHLEVNFPEVLPTSSTTTSSLPPKVAP